MRFESDSRVAVQLERPGYSQAPPYHASERYPEWPGAALGEDNPAYRAIRGLFMSLGLDASRRDTADWNPLGDIIRTGNRVVIKPNLVSHKNLGERSYGLTDTDSLITHGSVIRAVLDYAGKALHGKGSVLIADCPLQGTDWEQVVQLAGLETIAADFRESFPGVSLTIHDFRLGIGVVRNGALVQRMTRPTNGVQSVEIDLGKASRLEAITNRKCDFGVAQYGRSRMRAAHGPGHHRYLIPSDILTADVFLNLPKVKTHMKAGFTCALKNLVGINAHKDYLPHFRYGGPKTGGDEYPDGSGLWHLMWDFTHSDWERDQGAAKAAFRTAARVCSRLLRFGGYPRWAGELGSGSWCGNDTIWRTVLDINALLFYYDPKLQSIAPRPRRTMRYLAIADGLVGGEGEGPLSPTPVASGFMTAAGNPLALDCVTAALMGFDLAKLRQLTGAFVSSKLPLADFAIGDIEIAGLRGVTAVRDIYASGACYHFRPTHGFEGHIEHRPHGRTEPSPRPSRNVRHYFPCKAREAVRP
jgi:uncharacterized protein (DUF362 family)